MGNSPSTCNLGCRFPEGTAKVTWRRVALPTSRFKITVVVVLWQTIDGLLIGEPRGFPPGLVGENEAHIADQTLEKSRIALAPPGHGNPIGVQFVLPLALGSSLFMER